MPVPRDRSTHRDQALSIARRPAVAHPARFGATVSISVSVPADLRQRRGTFLNLTDGSKMVPMASSVLQRLRALCLSLPETSERLSWGHPNFRAGKKTFVTFERVHGRPSIAFRLDHADIERLTRRKQFFATPYGRGLWISMWADTSFNWPSVRDLVLRSYRLVALKRMIAALEGRSHKL